MTEVAIIGNGPSRDILENDNKTFDIRVACNFANIDAEYRVFADAFAARLYREGQKYHHRFGESKIVLGERAAGNLCGIKARPGSVPTMLDWFKEEGVLETIVTYPAQFRNAQRYLSSGHLAYMFAVEHLEPATIHMFGFDSMFTGDHLASYSNLEVREWGEQAHIKRQQLDVPKDGAQTWSNYWNELFRHYGGPDEGTRRYPDTFFYGYEGDEVFALEEKGIEPVYIRQKG